MTGIEYIKEAVVYNRDNFISMNIGVDGVDVMRILGIPGHTNNYVVPWIEIEYAKSNPIIEAIYRLK